MLAKSRAPRYVFASLALASITLLSGCGALVVGGAAATTAVVATDRRTTGEQVEDRAIDMKVAAQMRTLFGDNARVNAMSYAGLVLLTGDVPTAADKQRAGDAAATVEKVVKVVNELRVGEITPLTVRTNDTWLTSKVKTALINTKDVPSRTIAITTERGVVYMLGRVTQEEGQRAGIAASSVAGINRVVKAFDIIPAGSLEEKPAPIQEVNTSSASMPQSETADIQAMPVN
ncbi:BON domain-containing protein [Alcaligenaceae bacterium]|nr:BON domain-containing protein [Alcaligenaceae bacterium]